MTDHGLRVVGPPGAIVSALAVDEDGTVLAEHHPDRAVAPASNVKLVTTALALEVLGPDYRIETILGTTAKQVEGRLDGDLRLVGGGAPDLDRADLRRVLTRAGESIDRVTGDLVLDTTLFNGGPYAPGRAWEDAQYAYGAPTSALFVDRNTSTLTVESDNTGVVDTTVKPSSPTLDPQLDIRVPETGCGEDAGETDLTVRAEACDGVVSIEGDLIAGDTVVTDVPICRPDTHLQKVMASLLADAAIDVEGDVIWEREQSRLESESTPLSTVQSAPLSNLLRDMNVTSDNVTADTLARVVAAHATGEGSWTAWEDVVADRLQSLGVEAGRIADGSGLSRYNRLSARGVLTLLRHADAQEWGSAFFDSLPKPGEGTLADRLGDLPVRAKTGTLTDVRALSGRISRGDGSVFFALLVDGITRDADGVRDAQDAVVRSLADSL